MDPSTRISLNSTQNNNNIGGLPSTDGRKSKSLALAVAGVALLFLTVIGGVFLGLILMFAKNSDGERALWKGFKYNAGMFFNIKDMHGTDLKACGLVGDSARLRDDKTRYQAQWANTVFQVKVGDGIGSNSHSTILSAQLTLEQVEDFAKMGGTCVIAAQEKWEQKNEKGLKQFAEASNYTEQTLHGVPVLVGNYFNANGEAIRNENGEPVIQILVNLQDHQEINVDTLDGLADILNEQIQKGHVDVHCKSGRGRSAQIQVAYLMKYQNLTVDQAIERVSDARRFADVKKAKLKVLFYNYAFTKLGRNNDYDDDSKNLVSITDKKELNKLLKASKKANHEDITTTLDLNEFFRGIPLADL